MYEYNIKLSFKVENCSGCPFRHENIIYENIDSVDKLSGVTCITRRMSDCVLKNELITNNELVEAYDSKCPLKGNILYREDKK